MIQFLLYLFTYKYHSKSVVLYLLVFVIILPIPTFSQKKEIKHKVEFQHPGIESDETQTGTLIEIQDETRKATQYYMDVESVICDDHQCKIEKVRMFWDIFGFYTHYELPKGVVLEKAQGKPFSVNDYQKLQHILLDSDSPIRNYYRDKIIKVGHGASEGVDAFSGATVLVDKNEIVEGAAWTTCTLWHWANGLFFSIIRQITALEYTNQELVLGLVNGTEKFKIVAIEELTRKKIYDSKTVLVILNNSNKNIDLIKVIISYLEKAPETIFYDSFQKLFSKSENNNRIVLLNSLKNKKDDASPAFYNWLSSQLKFHKSYQELQLILGILESNKAVTEITIDEAIPLLNDSSFITARSIYWFLKDKKLSQEQQKQLLLFYTKNSTKL